MISNLLKLLSQIANENQKLFRILICVARLLFKSGEIMFVLRFLILVYISQSTAIAYENFSRYMNENSVGYEFACSAYFEYIEQKFGNDLDLLEKSFVTQREIECRKLQFWANMRGENFKSSIVPSKTEVEAWYENSVYKQLISELEIDIEEQLNLDSPDYRLEEFISISGQFELGLMEKYRKALVEIGWKRVEKYYDELHYTEIPYGFEDVLYGHMHALVEAYVKIGEFSEARRIYLLYVEYITPETEVDYYSMFEAGKREIYAEVMNDELKRLEAEYQR